MKKQVLGVSIDDIKMDEALKIVEGWLKSWGKHYIVTPNPEFLVMAQKDKEFKKVLNNADLAIPDGVGLKLSGDIVCNISGIDFMEGLISRSEVWASTIGLLGGQVGVAKECAERLRKKYPKARIVYVDSGGIIDENGEWVEGKLPNYLRLPTLDILFVAFGPPKQEKWIAKNLKEIPVKVAMGVGGSFDYISGRVIRAPRFIRSLGLEWLFRLINQPWRIKRQLALLKYLWLLCKLKMYGKRDKR